MKKVSLSVLSMILCFGTITKAQTYVGDLNHDFDGVFIPGCFISTGHPYLIYEGWDDENDTPMYQIYQSDFVTPVTTIKIDKVMRVGYLDFDIYQSFKEGVYFTQNLFNNDSYFEYFDCDKIDNYSNISNLYVKSTNGNTIWTYSGHTDDESVQILKFDNRFYLLIWDKDDDETHMYLIKQNQGISEVETKLPLSVFPSLLRHEEQITVELGEENNAREITVVNSLGQIVKRVPVEEGQRTVTIPARDLNSGLNVVSTRSAKGQGSCKIIVQ